MHSSLDLSSLQILLAEDNLISQQVTLLMLEQLDCSATVANNGYEALEALQAQSYDLLLMDLQMPGMDGLEATRLIRQIWPLDRCPWIIAITATMLSDESAHYVEVGMNGWLNKPLQLDELEAALRECLAAMVPDQRPSDFLLVPDAPTSLEVAAIDRTTLENLRNSMGKHASVMMSRLITCYLTEAPKQLQLIRQAAETQDALTLMQVAHSLKSSSGALGATGCFQLCQILEEQGRLDKLETVTETVQALEQEFEIVSVALAQQF